MDITALKRLSVLYRCPVCDRPGHGNLLGGAVHCKHCGAAFVSFTSREPAFVTLSKLNSGEAVLMARRLIKETGYTGRLRIEAEERLLVPWRLIITERLIDDDEPRREESICLSAARNLEAMLLPDIDPLTPRLGGPDTGGLTLEPLEEERLSGGDLLLSADKAEPESDETADPTVVSRYDVLIYYPLWRIVFTSEGGPDWPLILDGLGGQLVAGEPPRGKRTMPAFWVGVPALGAYALGCLVNLFSGGLSGFEWLTMIGALMGVGGLFYLKSRRAEQARRGEGA